MPDLPDFQGVLNMAHGAQDQLKPGDKELKLCRAVRLLPLHRALLLVGTRSEQSARVLSTARVSIATNAMIPYS